jgi:hypothetical protein
MYINVFVLLSRCADIDYGDVIQLSTVTISRRRTEYCHNHAYYVLRRFYRCGKLCIQFQNRIREECSKYVMAGAHGAKGKNDQTTRSV